MNFEDPKGLEGTAESTPLYRTILNFLRTVVTPVGVALSNKVLRILIAVTAVLLNVGVVALELNSGNNNQNGLYYFYHGTTVSAAQNIVVSVQPIANSGTTFGNGFYTYSPLVPNYKSLRCMEDASDEADKMTKGNWANGAVVEVAMLKSDFDYMDSRGWVVVVNSDPEAKVVKFSYDPQSLAYLNAKSSRMWKNLDSTGYVTSFP